jgi:hypothetical protein
MDVVVVIAAMDAVEGGLVLEVWVIKFEAEEVLGLVHKCQQFPWECRLIWETYPGEDNIVTDQLQVTIVCPSGSVVVHQSCELKIVVESGGVVGDGSGKELVVIVSVKKMLCPSELVVGVTKTSLQTVVMVARVTSTVEGEEAIFVVISVVDVVEDISGMVAVTVVLPVIEIDVSVIVEMPVPGVAPL